MARALDIICTQHNRRRLVIGYYLPGMAGSCILAPVIIDPRQNLHHHPVRPGPRQVTIKASQCLSTCVGVASTVASRQFAAESQWKFIYPFIMCTLRSTRISLFMGRINNTNPLTSFVKGWEVIGVLEVKTLTIPHKGPQRPSQHSC